VLTRVLSDLAGFSSFFAEFLFTLVAAVFLLIPYLWLTQKRRDFDAYGLSWNGWRRAIGLGLLLSLITTVPFVAGYHVWRTEVLGHEFEFRWNNYERLPLEVEGAPPQGADIDRPAVHLWKDGARVFLQWTAGAGDHRLDIDLKAPNGELLMETGRAWVHDPAVRVRGEPASSITLISHTKAPVLRRARFLVRGGDALSVAVRLDRKLVTREILRVGASQLKPAAAGDFDEETQVLEMSRSLTWLPLMLLLQLLVVALPEEFFYRGYLQTTFARAWPARWRLGPFHLGPAIIVTSLLFAIGHFVIDLRPARLAVFFPSLAFGWLRDRSGTIVSAVVYHAACNLMVQATALHYV
jgi:membrane protease YdiL (CAAX protease family)